MSFYNHFALLGYAEHQQPHGKLSHAYRIVNPAANVREHFLEFGGNRSATNKRVIEYTDPSDPTSFENFLRAHPNAFVWFHARWCGHCVQMENDYNVAAEAVKNVSFIKVDADRHGALITRYQIEGFPTLKLFTNGKPVFEYDKKRNSAEFIKWLNQHV